MPRLRTLMVLALLVGTAAGCSLLHELQPHRLRKLNSGPAPSFDPEFSSRDSSAAAELASTTPDPRVLVRAQTP